MVSRNLAIVIAKINVLKELKFINDMESLHKRKHKYWVNPYLSDRSGNDIESKLNKLIWDDESNFTQLTVSQFQSLLELVSQLLRNIK